MWIGILFMFGAGAYLAWSLSKGKIFVTLGTDLHKQTRLINRDENPKIFWVIWLTSAAALVVFIAYMTRTALS